MRRDDGSRGIVPGLVLITLGLLFLAERLNVGSGWRVEHLWPVLLIVAGIGRMIVPRADGHRGGGMWLALTGVLLLLHQTHVMPLERSWPLFIVGGGLSIIFGLGRRSPDVPPQEESQK
jgi:hypothetical protein